MVIAVYSRLSLDRSGQMVQVRRQVVDCEAIAAARWRDHTLIYYDDNDTSAYRPKVRRANYQRMLTDIRDGRVQGVVAWNLDRLLRQPRELEGLIDLGVIVVTAQGDLDLTTHDGQLHARILVAVAKKSSDDTSRRVARASRDRAESGRFHGGRYIPYGLVKLDGKYTHDLPAVQTITLVATRVLDGERLTGIIRGLAPPPPHTREACHRSLTGPTVRGMNRAGHVAEWPPMIDPVTAAALHTALAVKTYRPSVKWPLSPVLICGECGAHMVGSQGVSPGRAVNRPHYICRGKACTSISAPALEQWVGFALDAAVVVAPREVAPVRDVRRERALEHLTEQYALGEITRGMWEAALKVLTRHPDEGQPSAGHAQQVSKAEPGNLAGWRRLVAIDHILIDKARAKGVRFDEGRVHIFWRS